MTAKAEVTQDYDIHLDTTLIHLFYEHGNVAPVTLILENQCAHQLTLTITSGSTHLMISPALTTIILPPGTGSTREMKISVLLPFEGTAGTYQLMITTKVTRVDGAFIENGRERHASVLALVHRYHMVDVETGYVQVPSVGAVTRTILLNNTGNDRDYFSLEFTSTDDIMCYPAVDYLEIGKGEIGEYPIILVLGKGTPEGETTIELKIRSLCDDNSIFNRILTIFIDEEIKEKDTTHSILSSSLIIMGIILLTILFSLLSRPIWRSRIMKFIRSPFHSYCFLLIITGSMLLLPISTSTQAQPVPESSITIDGSMNLDASPFTPDEASVEMLTVTISSDEPDEQVVVIVFDSPNVQFGHVREHRIPANGQRSFTLRAGVSKGSRNIKTVGNLFIRTIEREGVAVNDGSGNQTGFFISLKPYSHPMITTEYSILQTNLGRPLTLEIELTNRGNAMDLYHIDVDNREELEGVGITVSNAIVTKNLEPNQTSHPIFFLNVPSNLPEKYILIRFVAHGEMDSPENGGRGCTLLLVDGDDGKEDTGFPVIERNLEIAGIAIALCCGAVLYMRRRRKSISTDPADASCVDDSSIPIPDPKLNVSYPFAGPPLKGPKSIKPPTKILGHEGKRAHLCEERRGH